MWSWGNPASRRISGAPDRYAIKGIEVWWNKLQIHRILVPARPDGFSALQVEKAIFDGSALSDRYLGLMTYFAAGK
jgi:hypothetical protein